MPEEKTPVHVEIEGNPDNEHGVVVALYFKGAVTDDEVRAVCKNNQLPLRVLKGEVPEWAVCPTPVSELAGLARVLVFNVG